MKKSTITIATRESPLALWQANWVKDQLEKHHSHLTVTLLGMTTKGDQIPETPLYKIGGKGLFVKELEQALLDGRADIAVHSMKDVPMELPPELCLPVMCEREDPRDAFVSNKFASLQELPPNAVVGTSSLRRQRQLLELRPDLSMTFLRGNVNTRLSKLDKGEYDAIILAAAGLQRLNFASRIRSFLSIEESLPAAGQGVLGIECRIDDAETKQLLAPLNDPISFTRVSAERAVTRRLGGGCHVPIGAYADIQQGQLMLRGLVAAVNGSLILRARQIGSMEQAEELGTNVAEDLLRQGAQTILAEK